MLRTKDGYIVPTGASTVNSSISNLEMCDYAASKLKSSGFVLAYTSMRSEACYYSLPGGAGVIRIAAHKYGRNESRALNDKVVISITFAAQFKVNSLDKLNDLIANAIGRYILYQQPKKITVVEDSTQGG